MHKLVVHRVKTVLDGALEVSVDLEHHQSGPPVRLVVLRHSVERRALRLRQVSQEREDDAVALEHRVAVHFGPGRNGAFRAEGRDMHTAPGPVELPAVIRAGEMAIDDLPPAQRTTPVNAGVGEHMGLPAGRPKGHEGQAENPGAGGGRRRELGAQADGIPEIHVHGA